MDNAGNCNTMVEHLSRLVPSFRGASSRTRCFPHTVNLIAKVSAMLSFFTIKLLANVTMVHGAFISFFYRQRSKPKATEPEKPTKHGGRNKQPSPGDPAANGPNDPDLIAVPEPTPEEVGMCAALEDADLEDVKAVGLDKAVHDKQAVATVRTEAVTIAKVKYKMELNSEEAQMAVGLFPKV